MRHRAAPPPARPAAGPAHRARPAHPPCRRARGASARQRRHRRSPRPRPRGRPIGSCAAVTRRGGFRELITRNADADTILIELKVRMTLPVIGPRTVTYSLEIADRGSRIVVAREQLQYTRFGGGKPYRFLDFREGSGSAITNEPDLTGENPERREEQKLDEPDILAIKGLGQFQRFEAARAFRSLIENWHVSDFHVSAARPSQEAGYAEHLSTQGENLPLVAQYLFEQHRAVFDRVLAKMAKRVPGIAGIEPTQTVDGRLVLRFRDGAFRDPFVARSVSDGTIKMFAYLVLLHDPKPHPLLCVEEPENQLYPLLLQELSEEFADYARRGGQVLVSTHSPDLLNSVPLESIFVLIKGRGTTRIHPASDSELLRGFVEQGDQPGALWRQRLFEGAFA
ncbi:AAA family ATPase [Leptolyngbya sp. 15MV]|nr:AAA family ATPase [Leptolyngbya sp. 15MV]